MQSNFFEIRIHARAGQGAKTAAQFIAEAAMDAGKYVQAFPYYGPERQGAPMEAYVRIADQPICLHSGLIHAEAVLVIDPDLLTAATLTGLAPDALIIVNTPESVDKIKAKLNFTGRLYTVDASTIALELLKKDIPNLVLTGALVKLTNLISLDKLIQITEKKFTKKYGPEMTQANVQAIKRGYDAV